MVVGEIWIYCIVIEIDDVGLFIEIGLGLCFVVCIEDLFVLCDYSFDYWLVVICGIDFFVLENYIVNGCRGVCLWCVYCGIIGGVGGGLFVGC